jgi:hypothetical protein
MTYTDSTIANTVLGWKLELTLNNALNSSLEWKKRFETN